MGDSCWSCGPFFLFFIGTSFTFFPPAFRENDALSRREARFIRLWSPPILQRYSTILQQPPPTCLPIHVPNSNWTLTQCTCTSRALPTDSAGTSRLLQQPFCRPITQVRFKRLQTISILESICARAALTTLHHRVPSLPPAIGLGLAYFSSMLASMELIDRSSEAVRQ